MTTAGESKRAAQGLGRALMLGAVLVLGGCVSLEQEYPDKRFFVLTARRTEPRRSAVAGARLKVQGLRITPRSEGRELVLKTGAEEYRSDYYANWFTEPSALASEATLAWMTDCGLFELVVDGGSSVTGTHSLEGAVTDLHADLTGEPAAVVGLQLVLMVVEHGRPRPIFHSRERVRVPLAGTTPEAIAEGLNAGLAKALAAFESKLVKRGLPGTVKPG